VQEEALEKGPEQMPKEGGEASGLTIEKSLIGQPRSAWIRARRRTALQ
jgi:hypothetical protein